MKRIFLVLFFLTMICTGMLTACGKVGGSEEGSAKSDVGSAEQEQSAGDMSKGNGSVRNNDKTIILYFSYSGNTEQIAGWIQEYTDARMIKLEALEPYPDDYDACVERAEGEHHDQARPALKTDVSLISDYDTIILGWPCWNYSCPMLIRTMLEQYDFSGKTIIPFTTSDVSGFAGSLDEMKESAPNAIFEKNGLEVRAKDVEDAQDTVNEWLSSLGFVKGGSKKDSSVTENNMETEVTNDMTMNVVINGTNYKATLDDGKAAKELKNMLPLTLNMNELNGNEKYADLAQGLTQDTYSPKQIKAGDILLWGSDTLVVFYEDFPTSYSYTKIGRIDNPDGIKDAVGKGSVEITFE